MLSTGITLVMCIAIGARAELQVSHFHYWWCFRYAFL